MLNQGEDLEPFHPRLLQLAERKGKKRNADMIVSFLVSDSFSRGGTVTEGVAIASNSDVKGKKRAVDSKLPHPSSSFPVPAPTFSGSISTSTSNSAHPYQLSKSSRKRMNRKTRENLSLGSMAVVEDALGSILDPGATSNTVDDGDVNDDDDVDEDDDDDEGMSMDGSGPGNKKKRRKGKKAKKAPHQGSDGVKPKIGEGKGRTLKEKQRKEQM